SSYIIFYFSFFCFFLFFHYFLISLLFFIFFYYFYFFISLYFFFFFFFFFFFIFFFFFFFFFFQAEDGIRDRNVTGVQTCALPISLALICQTKRFKAAVITAAILHPDLVADYLNQRPEAADATGGYYEQDRKSVV